MYYQNNFRYGEISKKNAGRFDTEAYQQGAFSFKNAIALTEGGATRRPPLKSIYEKDETMMDIDSLLRIIPFVISESISFVIGLSDSQICVFQLTDEKLIMITHSDYPSTPTEKIRMTASIANSVCFSQYYNRIYFASQSFRPFYLDFDLSTSTFTVSFVTLILNQDAKKRIMFTPSIVRDEEGKEQTSLEGRYLFLGSDGNYYLDDEMTEKYEYAIQYPPVNASNTYISNYDEYPDDYLLETQNDYPAIVSIIFDSLWFACTRNNPATLWKSRVLGSSQWIKEYSCDSMHDFTRFQQVITESIGIADQEDIPKIEATTSDGSILYEEENGNPKWYACKDVDGEKQYIRRIYKNYSAGSDSTKFYTDSTCSVEYIFQDGEYSSKKPYMVYDLSDYENLVTTKTNVDFVTTDSCACRISFNTGRQDRITFIKGALEKIIVGTSTGERYLPADFSAVSNLASKPFENFGSLSVQPILLNSSLIFLQRDNILREFYLYEGYINNSDITAYSKHIIDGNVRIIEAKNTPNPMVYILMEDGTMRVLTYDKQLGIQAFSRWEFDGISIESLSTIDNGNSQIICALCSVGNKKMICYFDEKEDESFIDIGTYPYETEIETVYAEIINDSLTFGRYKKAKVMWIRPYNTGNMMLGNDRRTLTKTRTRLGSNDYRHTIVGNASSQFSIVIKSVDDEPMTLLAMSWEVDNGV